MEKCPILWPGSDVLFENVTKHHIQESQEVRPLSTGDNKDATCQHFYPLACIRTFFHGRGFAEHQSSQSLSVSGSVSWLVKMLITLELRGIFGSNCIRVYLNTVQPLVCTTVTRLLGKFKT